MSERVGFFTPVSYADVGPRTWKQKMIQGVDSYFDLGGFCYLGGRKAYVIDTKPIDGKIMVQLRDEKQKTLMVALKVVSFVILAVPLLIVKLIIRMTHSYQVMTPRDLLEKVENMQSSNYPTEKAAIVERKKHLLATAYSMCIREIEKGDHKSRPKVESAFSAGEILVRFARLNYGDRKLDPAGKDQIHSFVIARHILLGALNAQLYAAGVIDKSFDFTLTSARNLRDMPKTIKNTKPFDAMEATFRGLDTDAVYQKLKDAKLNSQQRISLCATLRYLNGVKRHTLWHEKRDPTNEEIDFCKKLLLLAEKVIQVDAEKDLKVLDEHWELRYNDFPYYYETMTKEPAKVQSNWDWLYDTAKKMPETYLRNICRCANKQAKTVDQHRSALQLAIKGVTATGTLDNDVAVNLEDILEHNKYNQVLIEKVAKQLVELDPKGISLNIAWFALVPNNLAAAMLRDNPHDLESVKGLLCLSREIVKVYEKAGIDHHNFNAIKHNYSLLGLLSSTALVKKTMEEETKKVAEVNKSATLKHEDLLRLDYATNHIKRKLNDLQSALKEMQEHSAGVDYAAQMAEVKKMQQDANSLYLALEKVSEQTQKEARAELVKVEALIKRCLDFANDLFKKATPKKA